MLVSSGGIGTIWTNIVFDPTKIDKIIYGEHPIGITLHMAVFSSSGYIMDITQHFHPTVQLVPAVEQAAIPVDDASLSMAMEKCISAREFIWMPGSNGPYLQGEIYADKPPVPLAFKVFMRVGNVEQPLDATSFARRDYDWMVQSPVKAFDSAEVDLILRPDREAAIRTVDIDRYWNHEIVIHHVKIAGHP